MGKKITITVFEDGETWSAGPVSTLKCSKEQLELLNDGAKPKDIWPNLGKESQLKKDKTIDPFNLSDLDSFWS
mgnify:CR=1 FL=1|tara:strand:+ start:453 stop:671 length:219 start_codon:yes stop_codon:yes gene_type:complete